MTSQPPAKATPILDGILDDLAWEIETERATTWLRGLHDPIHHQRDLRPEARYLYMVLRDYAYAYPEQDFPSHDELAFVLNASINSIGRWIKELHLAGLLYIKRRGQGLTNHYELVEWNWRPTNG